MKAPRQPTGPDGKPREWMPSEMYRLYAMGFRDGAATKAMQHAGYESYDRGYSDGRKARQDAVAAYCQEIGYQPTILRLADSASTEAEQAGKDRP